MDGYLFEADLPGQVGPFVPPICLSPLTAQVLALALILLLGVALQETFAPARDRRR